MFQKDLKDSRKISNVLEGSKIFQKDQECSKRIRKVQKLPRRFRHTSHEYHLIHTKTLQFVAFRKKQHFHTQTQSGSEMKLANTWPLALFVALLAISLTLASDASNSRELDKATGITRQSALIILRVKKISLNFVVSLFVG